MFDPAQASFDEVLTSPRPRLVEADALIADLVATARRENQQAATRLTIIGDLYGCADRSARRGQ